MDSINKVIIDYDAPDGEQITKVWRFNADAIQDYRLEQVKSEIMKIFPSIAHRRLGISLSYKNSLAGAIILESDANLQVSCMRGCMVGCKFTCRCTS